MIIEGGEGKLKPEWNALPRSMPGTETDAVVVVCGDDVMKTMAGTRNKNGVAALPDVRFSSLKSYFTDHKLKTDTKPKEKPTEKLRERSNEKPKEKSKERSKERPKERSKERPKERSKEKPRERSKERPKERPPVVSPLVSLRNKVGFG